LSTLEVDELELGRSGLNLLLEQVESGRAAGPAEIPIPQHVVWRESTGPYRPSVPR